MLSLDYYLQLWCLTNVMKYRIEVILDYCLLYNHDNPVIYNIHLLLVFVFNLCFLCKEPALMGSCLSGFWPFWRINSVVVVVVIKNRLTTFRTHSNVVNLF